MGNRRYMGMDLGDNLDGGDESYLPELKELLEEKLGLRLPSHTDAKTLLRDLTIALHAHPGRRGSDLSEDAEGEDVNAGMDRGRKTTLSRRRLARGRRPISAARGRQVAAEVLRNAGISIN